MKLLFKKKRLGLIYLTLIILGLLMPGCDKAGIFESPTPTVLPIELRNNSWLTGNPCFSPCWQELILDISTEEDVISTVSSLSYVINSDIRKSVGGWHDALTGEYFDATVIRFPIIGETVIGITIADNVIKYIHIVLNFEITIDEIINLRGIPDYVTMTPDFNTSYCNVEIFWLEDQFITISRIEGDGWKDICMDILGGGKIDRNMQVTAVEFIYENWLIAMIDRGAEPSWPGFID